MTVDPSVAGQVGHLLGPGTKVGFGELSVVPDGGEFIVGDPASGIYLGLPSVGVSAIEQFRDGRTIAEVTASLSEAAGESVSVDEFVRDLIEAGLVRSLDGVPVGMHAPGRDRRRWIAGVRPEHARWLFGRVAWMFYGVCAVWCGVVLVFLPEYRPSFASIMFYPDPAISLAAIAVIAIVSGSLHEVWHWLAARVEGASVRFALSRRAFLPVLETDLTQLWATTRRRRYGPLFAGLAFDVTVLAAALTLRLVAVPLLPPVVGRFLTVVVIIQVVAIILQCMICLRTDLYLILSTALGCRDLLSVTQLYLRERLWRLSASQRAEYDAAHPRDRLVAPWFAIVYIAGAGLLAWIFLNMWLPATAIGGGWMVYGLLYASPGQRTFWECIAITVILLSQTFLPLILYVRERITAARRAR